MFGFDIKIVERADDFKSGQNAQHTIVFAASWLRIEVGSNIDRKRVRVSSLAARKHIAHLIKTHRTASGLAPRLEKCAAFGVFVGHCLAIVTARNAGANFGHIH